MPRLNGTITEEQKMEFDSIKDELGLSNQGEVLAALLSAYREFQQIKQTSDLNLTEDEQELINKAISYSGMTREEIAKRGFIAEAKKAVSLAKHQADLSELDPEELKKKTFLGVAAIRIQKTVEKIMQHNDNQPEKQNKFYISESLVFKLSGSNRKAIKDYFENYHIMINDHNQKHGLSNEDNRKGKGVDIKSILNI